MLIRKSFCVLQEITEIFSRYDVTSGCLKHELTE